MVIEFVTGTKHNRLRHLHAEIQPVGRGYQVDWATGTQPRHGAGDIDPVPEIGIALGKIRQPDPGPVAGLEHDAEIRVAKFAVVTRRVQGIHPCLAGELTH